MSGFVNEPAFSPGIHDAFRVPILPIATVISGEGMHPVPLFFLQVELQNSTAITQIGIDICEVVIGATNFFFPKWHDLH